MCIHDQTLTSTLHTYTQTYAHTTLALTTLALTLTPTLIPTLTRTPTTTLTLTHAPPPFRSDLWCPRWCRERLKAGVEVTQAGAYTRPLFGST